MTYDKRLIRVILLLLAVTQIFWGSLSFQAEAKKAAAGPDPAIQAEADLKKSLDPLNDQLMKMMIKVQSRALLSPEEAGQLADLKYKLMDMMNQYPQSLLLARPVYQAGILFTEREEYNDAYELFHFVATGFSTNPYGLKAKGQVQQLEKRFGPAYFSVEAASTPAPASAAGTTPAVTAGK